MADEKMMFKSHVETCIDWTNLKPKRLALTGQASNSKFRVLNQVVNAEQTAIKLVPTIACPMLSTSCYPSSNLCSSLCLFYCFNSKCICCSDFVVQYLSQERLQWWGKTKTPLPASIDLLNFYCSKTASLNSTRYCVIMCMMTCQPTCCLSIEILISLASV